MSIVKSFSVGDGDTFYIEHGSDSFTIIDICLSDDNREDIVGEIKDKKRHKGITRFISTHPDNDHIQGLEYLDDEISIRNFYCVNNNAIKDDDTDDFKRYCELRDSNEKSFYLSKDCSRKWMNQKDDERGSAGISILWPEPQNEHFEQVLEDAAEGKSPNNISPIIRYSCGARFLWMGDLETDFMEAIEDDLSLSDVNILFAPHHGRASGKVPESLLKDMSPDIVIIGKAPSKHLNYYDGYNTISQNSAGDISFESVDNLVHIYVSSDPYTVDFLEDHSRNNTYGYYIGTLVL